MELEEHQNSHTGEKPFECDICKARFNRRSTLWNHKRIHSDNKPFVCPVCSMTFKWKNSLKCHKEMHLRKNETGSMDAEQLRQLTYAGARRKQGSDSSRRSKKRKIVSEACMPGTTLSDCSPYGNNNSILHAALMSTPPPGEHTPILHHTATPMSTGSNHSSPPSDPAPHTIADHKPQLTTPQHSHLVSAPTAVLNTPTGPPAVLNVHIISTPQQPTALLAQNQHHNQQMSFVSPTQGAPANGLRSPGQPAASGLQTAHPMAVGHPGGDYIPNVDLGFLHQQQMQQHYNMPPISYTQPPVTTHQTAVVDGAYIVKVLPYSEW